MENTKTLEESARAHFRPGPRALGLPFLVAVVLSLFSTGVALASCPDGTLNPEAPTETAEFAFLIGEWSCSIRQMQQDGRLGEPTTATWTGRYILDGWAIQDDWVSTDAQGNVSHGMNIRSFNPETRKWDNRWLASKSLQWLYFEAEMSGDRMVMTSDERRDATGRSYIARNVFHDITAESWKWRQDRSFDNGATWLEGVAVIEARLQDGCRPASLPTDETALNALGFFDQVAGEWHGEGQLFGQPAEFEMIWEWELDRNFVRLTFSIHGATEMEAIGHYRIRETEPLAGIWLDTRGEFVKLSATVTDAGLETIWRSPTEKGRTTYELTGTDSLEVHDYYHDGADWKLFGTARYLRVRAER